MFFGSNAAASLVDCSFTGNALFPTTSGTSVLDVSNVSPDHAVSSDLSSASSVEIVRGPATLLYGPNAIGGVVNITDGRIAEKAMGNGEMDGYFDTKYGSADELFSLSGGLNLGAGPLVFHLDAFTKSTEDLEIPGFARSRDLRQVDPQPDEARGFCRTVPRSRPGEHSARLIFGKKASSGPRFPGWIRNTDWWRKKAFSSISSSGVGICAALFTSR
ncbi:MAG: hypothetical protein HC767_04180 [Akkermansiaceae bacterium]|nr:hypothetical protein [Akkermansiaceae bacterium]